ncbi:MAG: acetyl-CoA carboxylase carboxyl transferase subunit beta [Dehalococcoidia bacterium]|nr:acetyl-CoA carboxylase carboxyl transferase subunit beta [Dehalococcoidia bacterium]
MVRSFGGLLSALFGRGRKGETESELRDSCLLCGSQLKGIPLYDTYRVCPNCRFHYTLTAKDRIKLLIDLKGFKEKFLTVSSLDPLAFSGKVPYRKRLFKDQRRTGLNEAAVVGRGKIGGRYCVVVCLDFGFMGGSMGCVVGEKVALAYEYALQRGWPLLMVVTSAGVRMQEGVLSLMQMAKTTIAANQFHKAGLASVCVIASPTTGQAYASFVNLADVLIAEPGAILGFSPMRVLQQVAQGPLPQGAHTSEAHLKHGMIDMVVDREQLRPTVERLLDMLALKRVEARLKVPKQAKQKTKKELPSATTALQLAQVEGRPNASAYISRIFSDFIELHGDRVSGDDPTVVCGLATLEGASLMVVGQLSRTPGGNGPHPLTPEGFRKAQRAIQLAARFGTPVVTLIDTPGPSMTLESEEQGIGHAIATTMAIMAELPVPTIAAIIGQGGRESAMALSMADTILMMENAVFLPISPESAAGLMYRDVTKVAEAAESLRLTARNCLEMGVIDTLVPEPEGGAHKNPDEAATLLRLAIIHALADLQKNSISKLLKRRQQKFRTMGEYTNYFRAVLARELDAMREAAGEAALERKQKKDKKGKVIQMPVKSLGDGKRHEADTLPTGEKGKKE